MLFVILLLALLGATILELYLLPKLLKRAFANKRIHEMVSASEKVFEKMPPKEKKLHAVAFTLILAVVGAALFWGAPMSGVH